jgi:hypothetical protein
MLQADKSYSADIGRRFKLPTMNKLLIDAFGRVRGVVHAVVDTMGEEELSYRPSEAANSIAWLVWHLTRIQDDHIAEISGQEQVWTGAGWSEKFNLPLPDESTGFGHSAEEVVMVRASSDKLLGYYDAVHENTIEYIKSLKPKDFERIVDHSYEPPVTLAVRLVSILSDDLQHAGQAAYIKGLIKSA